jgi:hypothetical protein
MLNLDNAKDNKNTTLWGVGIILGAVGAVMANQFDGNTSTTAEWGAVLVAVLAGIKLIFGAKDAAEKP